MTASSESRSVVIDRRFCGPKTSGHGGYSASLLGTCHPASATVTLRLPPPLEKPLVIRPRGAGFVLLDDAAVVAESQDAPDAVVDLPTVPSLAEAAATDPAVVLADHIFPECFACGPARRPGDGLRIFVGRLPQVPHVLATEWRPDSDLADGAGAVDARFIWAALDCPSGWAALTNTDEPPVPALLGRMTVTIGAAVPVEEPTLVLAWRTGGEGRKIASSAALARPDGAVLASAEATWITLPDSHAVLMT